MVMGRSVFSARISARTVSRRKGARNLPAMRLEKRAKRMNRTTSFGQPRDFFLGVSFLENFGFSSWSVGSCRRGF